MLAPAAAGAIRTAKIKAFSRVVNPAIGINMCALDVQTHLIPFLFIIYMYYMHMVETIKSCWPADTVHSCRIDCLACQQDPVYVCLCICICVYIYIFSEFNQVLIVEPCLCQRRIRTVNS